MPIEEADQNNGAFEWLSESEEDVEPTRENEEHSSDEGEDQEEGQDPYVERRYPSRIRQHRIIEGAIPWSVVDL